MIIEGLLNAIASIIEYLFSWISLPPFPLAFKNSISTFFGYIFDNLGLIYLFIRPVTLKIAIPIFLAIINFDKIYKITMFIIRKIPIGIK